MAVPLAQQPSPSVVGPDVDSHAEEAGLERAWVEKKVSLLAGMLGEMKLY